MQFLGGQNDNAGNNANYDNAGMPDDIAPAPAMGAGPSGTEDDIPF